MIDPKQNDPMKYETILLDKLKFAAQGVISRYMAEDPPVLEAAMEHITGNLMLRLQKEILGETVGRQTHTITQYHPANWWQMWKDEHSKWWWVRKFLKRVDLIPHHTTIRWDQIATFPESKIKTPPEQRGPVMIAFNKLTYKSAYRSDPGAFSGYQEEWDA